MEDILPMVIFIIIGIVASIFKKAGNQQRQQKDTSGKPARPSLFASLKESLESMLDEAENKPRRQKKKKRNRKETPRQEQPIFTKREEKARTAPAPRPATTTPAISAQTFSRAPQKTLREAVLWSEILGTPVSLRRE